MEHSTKAQSDDFCAWRPEFKDFYDHRGVIRFIQNTESSGAAEEEDR